MTDAHIMLLSLLPGSILCDHGLQFAFIGARHTVQSFAVGLVDLCRHTNGQCEHILHAVMYALVLVRDMCACIEQL